MPLNKESRPNVFDSKNMTLTGYTTPDQSGPGSNGNEGVFHTPQISRTGAFSYAVQCHSSVHPFFCGGRGS